MNISRKLKINSIFTYVLFIVLTTSVVHAETSNEELLSEGLSLIKKDNYEQALQTFDKVLQTDENNLTALNNKARVLYIQQRHSEALELLDKSIKNKADSAEAWYLKGLITFELGNKPEAVEAFNKVLVIEPDNKAAKSALCTVIREQGMPHDALECFKELKKQFK